MRLRCELAWFFLAALLHAQPKPFDLTTVPTRNPPQSLVVGDFNRDGKPDLAVTGIDSAGNGTVEILLGNGDATFHSASLTTVGAHASRVVAADFNKDGKLDLAVSVGDAGKIVVLLGNGDGSFQTSHDVGAATPPGQFISEVPGLAAGDVNGDGNMDLVLGPYTMASSYSMAVLLGNGDGTFRSPVYSTLGQAIDLCGDVCRTSATHQALVADFNGAGKADVFLTVWAGSQWFGKAVSDAGGSLSVTWNTGYPFAFGTWMTSRDADGDGKPDVMAVLTFDYPYPGPMLVWTFLDGSKLVTSDTLPPQDNFRGRTYKSAVSVNVDGDGIPDLLVSDCCGNLLAMIGSGDGTFYGPPSYPPVSPSWTIYTGALTDSTHQYADQFRSMTAADFRGSGRQDVVMALTGKSVSLLKNGVGANPVVTPAGIVNAASMSAAPVVPGSLVAVFGDGLAYGTDTASSFSGTQWTRFGLTIQVNGIDATLLYVSPTQANIQIPWQLADQTQATILVTRNGATSKLTLPVAPYAPGLFTMNQQGAGQAAAVVNGTTAIAAPAGLFPGSRPIHRGEYLCLFGTGLGAITGGYPYTTTTPTVTVGSMNATVQFSGTPNMTGVYQINILIPDNAPIGNAVPVSLKIGGVNSNTVTIAID